LGSGVACAVITMGLTAPDLASSAPSAPVEDAVMATMNEAVAQTGIPGITFSFYGPQLSQSFAAGWADRESRTPMRSHSVMMGASTGKVLVAVLAYQEVAQGRLHYADKVSQYLGTDSAYNRLPGASQFTIQMLLTHSTGLIDGAVDLAAIKNSRGKWTNQRRFKAAWGTQLRFEPGTAYGYSDLNYQILAAVIESIEGEYFGALALSRIIEPLGLTDTAPATSRAVAGLASGYAGPTSKPQYENIKLPDKTAESGRLFMYPAFEGGGGGFSTSSPDLAKFMYGVFATSLIGPSERAHMTASFVPIDPPAAKRSYGAGIFRYETALGTAYGHSGVWFGYKTQVQYFPALCVAAAMQVNSQIDGEGNDLSQFKAHGRRFGMPDMLTELMTQAIAQTGVKAQCGQ
jgi:D-alanyl-D-alanine carboxypeptidase